MADFVLKASRLPDYSEFGSPFPLHFSTRLKRVQDIANAPGQLRKHADDLRALTKAIATWEAKRHTLVHGWLEVADRRSRPLLFRMRRFSPEKGNERNVLVSEFTLTEIKEAGKRLTVLADKAVMLFYDIYHEHRLEHD
ncbi:hypothetical protein [Brevundimonas sp. AAP58]|uniref:hypothetical protein n=1 Tax=Brevundimonas sp. AAP58 TaxID=1523422 RepID=UPI0012E3267A|nr:hypothetical protein [Brevundimonas sp. AAP58]